MIDIENFDKDFTMNAISKKFLADNITPSQFKTFKDSIKSQLFELSLIDVPLTRALLQEMILYFKFAEKSLRKIDSLQQKLFSDYE